MVDIQNRIPVEGLSVGGAIILRFRAPPATYARIGRMVFTGADE
jgi:hypothetical protein